MRVRESLGGVFGECSGGKWRVFGSGASVVAIANRYLVLSDKNIKGTRGMINF